MRQIKKLLLTFGIAGTLAVGAAVGVVSFEKMPEGVSASQQKIVEKAIGGALPTGWTITNGSQESSYWKVDSDGSLILPFSDIISQEGYYLDSALEVNYKIGTFGKWNAPKTVEGTASILDSNGNVISTATATSSGLAGDTKSYRMTTNLPKPNDPLSCHTFKVTFSNYKTMNATNSTLRLGGVKFTFNQNNAPLVQKSDVTSVLPGETNPTTVTSADGYLNEPLESQPLTAVVKYVSDPDDNDVTWTSKNDVASITSDGIMTFKTNGEANFEATSRTKPFRTLSVKVTATNLVGRPTQVLTETTENLKNLYNWQDGSLVSGFVLNNLLDVKFNEGKYEHYTKNNKNDHQIALYSNDTVTFAVPDGYRIKNINLDYYSNGKYLFDGQNQVNSKTDYECNTQSLVLTANGSSKIKVFNITVDYDPKASVCGIEASWAEGKGTYVVSKSGAAALSTADIIIKTKDGYGNVAQTISTGYGFTLDITNGGKVDTIDASFAEAKFNFDTYTPGKYNAVISYKGYTADLIINVVPLDVASITIKTQPKLTYNAHYDVYSEFEGGAVEAIKNDGGHTTSIKNFEFEYSVNGQPIDINTLLDTNGCFNVKEETSIKTDIYYKDLGRTVFASYNITVHPVTSLTATDANADTNYFTNIDYPMTAAVKTTINGTTYDVPETDYTISPATLNVSAAGEQTITVTYNKNTAITTTYVVNVKAPKGEPSEFAADINPITFTAGDKFVIPAQASYGMVTYLNDDGIYDITTLDNITFYLSEDITYDENDVLLNENSVMRYYDNAYDIIPVYTEGAKSIAGTPITFEVTTKEMPTYVAGSDSFSLLKDASLLEAGSEILFTDADTHTKISTTIPTDEDYLEQSTASYDANSGKVTITDKVIYKIELGGTTDAWTFKINGKYLDMNNSGKFSFTTNVNEAEKWTIAINASGVATVTSNADSQWLMQHNKSASRFRTYKSSSNQADVSIILNDPVVGTDPAQYIIDVIDTMRLNSETLVEGEGLSVCTLLDNPAWAKVKEVFNANKENHDFITALSVLDKYSDGKSTYLDTINKLLVVEPNSQPSMFGTLEDSGAIIYTIVGIAIVSITFIGAFALIANKKRHSLTK